MYNGKVAAAMFAFHPLPTLTVQTRKPDLAGRMAKTKQAHDEVMSAAYQEADPDIYRRTSGRPTSVELARRGQSATIVTYLVT